MEAFHPLVREWFKARYGTPTDAQTRAWPHLQAGKSTLLLAPTGSGKTLAAFLSFLDRLMFSNTPRSTGVRVLYVSPLKALGNDIERNLRTPLDELSDLAESRGVPFRRPEVGIRTGDTPADARARMKKRPPDILITTPESLYLMLTSEARSILESTEAVILDEIHSLLPTKRGAHLAVCLERLEARLVRHGRSLQRIGLSATQRPPENAARFLSGYAGPEPRPVEIVDASYRRSIRLELEVPPEGFSIEQNPSAPGDSTWPAIHRRLLERIRTHRSTIIFASNRRLAERLTADLNDLAGEVIAMSHHGSVAKEERLEIESRLKRGELPALVATSSLELGIDMGAVDQVLLIEAPGTIASGLQRIGRANHQVGAVPEGAVFPKHVSELLACAATVEAMLESNVEPTQALQNPLDILAQQIVAIVGMDTWAIDPLFALVTQACPFAQLPRSAFESVLDMLSGKYPSDAFAELRPRITWDRETGQISGRPGARRLSVLSGGTIPDRGLYPVILRGEDGSGRRIGELDEEMVFESREGEVFLLGSTSWRIDEITPDRVFVSPAPGEPGKMPFWRGEGPSRSVALGTKMGELARRLLEVPRDTALLELATRNKMSREGAQCLLDFLYRQVDATGAVPSDQAIIIERFSDEVGDYRVCVHTPFGQRVHAPWATAVCAKLRASTEAEITATWTDDGIIFRVPDMHPLPELPAFIPPSLELDELVTETLAETSLFAARFRENAGRALLIPRPFPGKRMPLWAQRRKSASLLRVATRFRNFPIILETYRECLEDSFDLPALREICRKVEDGRIRLVAVETPRPSPHAIALMFLYAGNFMYEGDLPLAERRAHVLSLDLEELRKLIGETELRAVIDPQVLMELERQLLRETVDLQSPDQLHDWLIELGDFAREDLERRHAAPWALELETKHRAFWVSIGGTDRLFAVEDAARVRDALGLPVPHWVPASFLTPVESPVEDLVSRFARTHGPFVEEELSRRHGLAPGVVRTALERLEVDGKVRKGGFRPGKTGLDWCHVDVLRALKARSLKTLRAEIRPVSPAAYSRFLLDWQGVLRKKRGLHALRAVIQQLEGAPIPLSVLETEVLPARIEAYRPSDLDQLCLSGEVIWRGVERLGTNDGRIALYFRQSRALYSATATPAPGELQAAIRARLRSTGASFFSELAAGVGGFPPQIRDALFDLVFAGEVTNDTLIPLRTLGRPEGKSIRGPLAGSEGRWGLMPTDVFPEAELRTAWARKLLERQGVLLASSLDREALPGPYSWLSPVFSAMEDARKVRRGMFVDLPGGLQVASPGAEDQLRTAREPLDPPRLLMLSACDPAQPYGVELAWPDRSGARPGRTAGARVILREGELIGWLGRGEGALMTFGTHTDGDDLARALASHAAPGRPMKVATVDGTKTDQSWLRPHLEQHGFVRGSKGALLKRGVRSLGGRSA